MTAPQTELPDDYRADAPLDTCGALAAVLESLRATRELVEVRLVDAERAVERLCEALEKRGQ